MCCHSKKDLSSSQIHVWSCQSCGVSFQIKCVTSVNEYLSIIFMLSLPKALHNMLHVVGVDVVSLQQTAVAGALHGKLWRRTHHPICYDLDSTLAQLLYFKLANDIKVIQMVHVLLCSITAIDNFIDKDLTSDRETLPAASGLPRTAPRSGSAAARTRSASSWSRRPLSRAWTRLRAATSCCSPRLEGAAAASRRRGGGSGHLDFHRTAALTPLAHSCSPVTLLPRDRKEKKKLSYTFSQKLLLLIAAFCLPGWPS